MDGAHFANGVELIDVPHLTRQTMGDRSLTRDILVMFRTHMSDLLNDLHNARTVAMWRLAAHTLKGTARTIGAKPLGEIAAEAEAMAREEALIDLSKNGDSRRRVLADLVLVASATDQRIQILLKVL